MAFWDQEQLLITVDKNKSEKINVKHCVLKDKEYIDIRIAFEKEGEFLPSSKGVSIPIEKVSDIIEAINAVVPGKPVLD